MVWQNEDHLNCVD
uniref:Uncharacterized protein n=1 Tax=Anguilla anguilla TaxID=7936 RepID=A0A0E9VMW7_ANGAN